MYIIIWGELSFMKKLPAWELLIRKGFFMTVKKLKAGS
jgi:hypothetical protein